jgi:phosphoribosylpyrophosphate synthetase
MFVHIMDKLVPRKDLQPIACEIDDFRGEINVRMGHSVTPQTLYILQLEANDLANAIVKSDGFHEFSLW